MSKSALRKELITFTGEQLVEVIMNAYDSSKGARDYFEFFLNPDVEGLMQKKIDLIAKELNRSKRGQCRGRISHIRRAIKEFDSFGPGAEHTATLMYRTLRMLVGQYGYVNYPETLVKGTLKLVEDFIVYCDKAGMAESALERLKTLSEEKGLGTPRFREAVRRRMTETLENMVAGRGKC